APLDRRLADAQRGRRLAAANVDDQPGQDGEAVVEEGGVDPSFEAAARVTGEAKRLAGARNAFRREISDFEHDVGRRVADPRILAAHDPADVMDLLVVRNDGHGRLELI